MNLILKKIICVRVVSGFFANIWFFSGQIGTSLDKLETSH